MNFEIETQAELNLRLVRFTADPIRESRIGPMT